MKCNHDNPPPYPNWIWSCSKCGQQFTNKLNTQEDKPMKPLSQTRQAIVEDVWKEWLAPYNEHDDCSKDCTKKWYEQENEKDFKDYLTQALNDYTESMIEKIKCFSEHGDWGEVYPDNINDFTYGYNLAFKLLLEELNK